MNEKDLLKGLSHIDEKYIQEAAMPHKAPRRTPLIRWVSIAAVFCILCGLILHLVNQAPPVSAQDLMEGIQANPVSAMPTDDANTTVTDFSLRLMQTVTADNSKNTLVSPLSVLYALSMMANGAEGETLAELEATLGMDIQQLNNWIYSFSQTVDERQLKVANSIWFTSEDHFQVNQNFLQTNADYFNADLYKAPFDQTTLDDINNWVNYRTDGMIPRILEEIPQEMVMYLINALTFDAKWYAEYEEDQVRPDDFTRANGTKVTTEFLFSEEYQYLQSDNTTGFIKPYQNGKYGFLALLPEEGLSVTEYLADLTGQELMDMIQNASNEEVKVSIPSFELTDSANLIDHLKQMGIQQLFDEDLADLSAMGTSQEGNIWVEKMLQKTYIKLDAHGTRAAAITIGGFANPTSAPAPAKTVYLDRPFVYMIVDMETGIPLFIGIITDPSI